MIVLNNLLEKKLQFLIEIVHKWFNHVEEAIFLSIYFYFAFIAQ